jgi:Zn-finger nucleic acid-binding protein
LLLIALRYCVLDAIVAVLCPKDRKTLLTCIRLVDGLEAQYCSDCKGTWLPSKDYESWRAQQPHQEPDPSKLTQPLNVERVQSAYDTRAALCPECNNYLSRAKVSVDPPFYVERCMACSGIWCDHGEWAVLEKLGLHTTIESLFTQEWQTKVRKHELADQERRATIAKLGPELATEVFHLAELLEKHPQGDFGVAYLMRRFDTKAVGPANKPN